LVLPLLWQLTQLDWKIGTTSLMKSTGRLTAGGMTRAGAAGAVFAAGGDADSSPRATNMLRPMTAQIPTTINRRCLRVVSLIEDR
jgi:hypothetical protein